MLRRGLIIRNRGTRFLSANSNSTLKANYTEDNARIIEHFGAKQRINNDGKRLFPFEDLISGWKSVTFLDKAVGNRAYSFQGSVSNLENALLSYAVSTALKLKPEFEFVTVDDVLPISTTVACGFPAPESSEHSLQYQLLDNKELCLSGTAEMGIAHKLKGQVLDNLPRWFLAKSRCFRHEVSNSKSEVKFYRVHEFFKVEMFVACHPQKSDAVLQEIVDIQKKVFSGLGLHCRLLGMPSEELGASASKKIDVEAWMPGRNLFGEISSASNCTDYQSQRLDIKFNDNGESKFVHTCNGTVLASTRALIATVETHQGTVRKTCAFPEVLKPWLPEKRTPLVGLKKLPALSYKFN